MPIEKSMIPTVKDLESGSRRPRSLRRFGSDRRTRFRLATRGCSDLGVSEAQLLDDYPALRVQDSSTPVLCAIHRDEIEVEIRENEDA